jgi:hypothetical protein
MTPVPQKNSEIPNQPDMTVQQKEQAKQRLLKIIQTAGVKPQDILRGEQYARQAMKNPKMYPVAIQAAVREGLLPPDTPITNQVDYKIIAIAITAGKLTAELMQEGKL